MFIKTRNPKEIQLQRQLQYLAKQLRNNPTPAEAMLWKYLRSKQLQGVKFRRQFPLYQYIVDFYCPKYHLIIELDGPIHQNKLMRDHARDNFLQQHGFIILRFTNEQGAYQLTFVITMITNAIHNSLPSL